VSAERFDVLIVGAGHGGAQAASALRQHGYAGTVALLGDEPHLPYERPPLSKEYLSREKEFERLLLRPERFWQDKAIALQLGRRVTRVDASAHEVVTADGLRIAYGSLIWAAGGSPRRLGCAGADLAGVHGIRTRADVDAMLDELTHAQRVVVIGGGYIGLEAAAVLRKLGRQVDLVELGERVLARVAGPEISRFYEAEHRAQGVRLHLGTAIEALEGSNGRVSAVRLSNGARLPADLVVVGIGIQPAVAPLLEAGAQGVDGVSVDARCRTTLAGVFAIGDCANHVSAYADGRRLRVESVQNANDQATTAALELCGKGSDYDALPWFWSNQYDLRLQTAGLSLGYDETLLRGDPARRAFTVIYLKQRRVIALDCVNSPADYVQGRKLVQARIAPSRELLCDPAVPLKTLVA
jgi:3-phenylpropionate/trans-cinnamate dioxygenase ferredoxin reductase subunit